MKSIRKEKGGRLNLPLFNTREPLPVIQPTVSSPMTPQYEEQNTCLLPGLGESEGTVHQLKDGVEYINIGEEDQSEVYGYRRSIFQTGLAWTFIVLTGGLLRLVFHWAPQLMLKATHIPCTLGEATRVLIVERYKKYRKCFVKDIKMLYADRVRYDQEYSALRSGVNVCKSSGSADVGVNLQERDSKAEEMPNPKHLVIPSPSGHMKNVTEVRWFSCKKFSYIWNSETESFYRLSGLDNGQTLADLHSYQGFSWLEQLRRRVVYGENIILVPVTPILKLLFLEALNPFYIFQVFSVCLWYADDYIYYASVIVITSVLSIISEVYQMHRNQVSLRSTIISSGVVEVLRENGLSETLPSEHLVPGDVLVVPPQGCMMQCDAVLLQGTAIVNESMLTGESVPVTKTPILNRKEVIFKEKEHGRHVLYCGTQVIQTRFYGNERVTAVVVRTGFLTSKGSLVRSIMYPPPVDFKFQQDAYKFILVLVGIASFGFAYTVFNKYRSGLTAGEIAMDSMDLITIVVPPALPMAMTVGILYALQRLKQYNIFCISPRSINISGVLNCICFDKTGTLTEDGLDMKGVVGATSACNGDVNLGKLVPEASMLAQDHFLFGMAACHSITMINMKMVGDPLDMKMFESTGWILEEPGNDDTSKYDMIMPSVVRPQNSVTRVDHDTVEEDSLEVGILRQFPFSSSLQRMSVITRKLHDAHFSLYCKGSPEMITSLSRAETIPWNLQEVLLGYTQRGFRVLALGWKPLKLSYTKAQRLSREEVENDLIFLGLLVFENRLKEETKSVITQLKKAKIRNVMVTGDSMLTALSVGRECGLVDQAEKVVTVKATKSPDGLDPAIQFESNMDYQMMKADKNQKYGTVLLNMEGNSKYTFAIEGKTWEVIYSQNPDMLKKLVVRGSIFARMNPDQKRQLVTELQALGYYVGMCGDGANDCGALKSAHVGISLSEAEASVASPFTSKEPNISCVPTLIREGRTALVTSFGVFKYMATYSLTQFVSVMILYSIHNNLTDIQFLYIDLFLITVFAFFFGRTDSFKGDLASRPPSSSLISVQPILSILLHMVIVIGFQTFAFFYVQQQPWFVPFNYTSSDEVVGGHENYAVYSISQFQYIILAVVFAKGPPYRRPLYTNYFFTGSVLLMTTFSVFMVVAPTENLVGIFEMDMPPKGVDGATFFRWQIILFAVVNSIVAVILEYFIIDYLIHGKLKCRCTSETNTKIKYLAIEQALQEDKDWPIVKMTDTRLENGSNELSLNAKKLVDVNSRNLKIVLNKAPLNEVISVTQYHSSL